MLVKVLNRPTREVDREVKNLQSYAIVLLRNKEGKLRTHNNECQNHSSFDLYLDFSYVVKESTKKEKESAP